MSITLSNGHGQALTGLANGTFVTVWNGSGNTPTAQFFNADGTQKGGPVVISSGSSEEKLNFRAASLSDGRFVVVWEQKGAKNGVYARIFDVEGSPAGNAFKIDSGDLAQTLPQVTALKNGGFAVASINEGVAITVTVDANGFQSSPVALKTGAVDIAIATLNNGNIVSVIGAGSSGSYAVHGDIQQPNGSDYASGELIPAFNDIDRPDSSVAALADGSFLFIHDSIQNGRDSVDLFRYSSDGTSIGNGTSFGAGAGEKVGSPVVKALPNGGFVFAYMMETATGKYVYSGSSNSNSLFLVTSSQVGVGEVGEQTLPQMTVLNDGRYIVSWLNTYNGVTTTKAEIFDTRYSGANWTGTAMSEQYVGTSYNDRLNAGAGNDSIVGGGGNDVLNGGGGADTMQGGADSDTYYVDDAGDQVIESSHGGTADHVITDITYTLGAYVERLTASGSSSIDLMGNSLANVINGNNGANKIYGGAGNDQLAGGGGQDTFVFDTKLNSKTNKDKIVDWTAKDDTIQLENGIFKKLKKTGVLKKASFVLGAKAKDSNDFVGYNKKTGDLWYDSNGSKGGGQVVFANIGKNKKIAYNDFFVI